MVSDPLHTDETSGWPGEHTGHCVEGVRSRQATVTLHQLEARMRIEVVQLALQPCDVLTQGQ